MIENNKIQIQLSKYKLAKLLIFSVLFLCGGLWMIITNPQTSNPVFNSPIVKALASYGGTIMGLFGIYFSSRKLFNNKPGIVIDEHGIYDNTSAFNFGLIPWSDISGIYERTVQASVASKQHFITIGLFNPEKYILGENNLLKKKLLYANARSYGSPIHISTNGLKIDHSELFQLMIEECTRYKNRS
jgi:hypothetical protein